MSKLPGPLGVPCVQRGKKQLKNGRPVRQVLSLTPKKNVAPNAGPARFELPPQSNESLAQEQQDYARVLELHAKAAEQRILRNPHIAERHKNTAAVPAPFILPPSTPETPIELRPVRQCRLKDSPLPASASVGKSPVVADTSMNGLRQEVAVVGAPAVGTPASFRMPPPLAASAQRSNTADKAKRISSTARSSSDRPSQWTTASDSSAPLSDDAMMPPPRMTGRPLPQQSLAPAAAAAIASIFGDDAVADMSFNPRANDVSTPRQAPPQGTIGSLRRRPPANTFFEEYRGDAAAATPLRRVVVDASAQKANATASTQKNVPSKNASEEKNAVSTETVLTQRNSGRNAPWSTSALKNALVPPAKQTANASTNETSQKSSTAKNGSVEPPATDAEEHASGDSPPPLPPRALFPAVAQASENAVEQSTLSRSALIRRAAASKNAGSAASQHGAGTFVVEERGDGAASKNGKMKEKGADVSKAKSVASSVRAATFVDEERESVFESPTPPEERDEAVAHSSHVMRPPRHVMRPSVAPSASNVSMAASTGRKRLGEPPANDAVDYLRAAANGVIPSLAATAKFRRLMSEKASQVPTPPQPRGSDVSMRSLSTQVPTPRSALVDRRVSALRGATDDDSPFLQQRLKKKVWYDEDTLADEAGTSAVRRSSNESSIKHYYETTAASGAEVETSGYVSADYSLLVAPKIIRPAAHPTPGVRRSRRTRVPRLAHPALHIRYKLSAEVPGTFDVVGVPDVKIEAKSVRRQLHFEAEYYKMPASKKFKELKREQKRKGSKAKAVKKEK